MSTSIQDNHAGADRQPKQLAALATSARLATILATPALVLAIAGVVYGPGFARAETTVAQRAQTSDLLATVGAALREQSPQCLLQTC